MSSWTSTVSGWRVLGCLSSLAVAEPELLRSRVVAVLLAAGSAACGWPVPAGGLVLSTSGRTTPSAAITTAATARAAERRRDLLPDGPRDRPSDRLPAGPAGGAPRPHYSSLPRS